MVNCQTGPSLGGGSSAKHFTGTGDVSQEMSSLGDTRSVNGVLDGDIPSSRGGGSSYIPLPDSSDASGANSWASSDLLSQRAHEGFNELGWVDHRGNSIDNDEAWKDNFFVRVGLGRHVGRRQPPDDVIMSHMYDDRPQPVWPEVGDWCKRKRRYYARKDLALGEDNSSWVARRLRGPLAEPADQEGMSSAMADTDAPIYLDSSAPQAFLVPAVAPMRFCVFNTGRLSKVEFWKILKDRLTPEVLDGVIRVQACRQPNGFPRMDMWIEARVAAGIKQGMYLTAQQRRLGTRDNYKFPMYRLAWMWAANAQTSHWRLDTWKSWRDRNLEKPPMRLTVRPPPQQGLATLNINGMGAKQPELENFLKWADVGIVALQETLIGRKKYRFHLPGYETYVRPAGKGFRGQALLVSHAYPSYEVSRSLDQSFIHVRVAKLRGRSPWHVISVYFPSGGNFRKERTRCLSQVIKEYREIMGKDPRAVVMIMGDFNMPRKKLEKSIKTERTGLTCMPVAGCGLTFHRKGSKWTDVDSMLVSPPCRTLMRSAKVVRNWGSDSDHFPLVAKMRPLAEAPEPTLVLPRYRFNVDLVKGHGKALVTNNRWSVLPVDPIEDADDLNESAARFCDIINVEALELGIKRQVVGETPFLNRQLKRVVDKVARARHAWESATAAGAAQADQLLRNYKLLRRSAKKSLRQRKAAIHQKEVKRVTKLYHDNEMRAFHRWESKMVVGPRDSAAVKPVLDKKGNLLIDETEIRERAFEYYRDLNQDDPDNLSRNRAHWKGKGMDRREHALPGLSDTPTWKELLLAIRRMALGTSPGHDNIPVEVYKALLKQECHQHLARQGTVVGDNIYVALPEEDLPEEPGTNMGRHLHRIIAGIWTVKRQPEFWSKVTNKSLFKSGDPTDLKNYRGISLIVVAMKIVTAAMADRLSTTLERHGLLVQEQGGFRRHEEAVAQFVALAEIVRRRRLKGNKTYVVFIDFLKAFDKVMHEALFEKMDAMGIRGPFLDLLRSIYSTSKACVKVGDRSSDYYDMVRGTRQGCPLSPVLFILFINDILKYVPQGVKVPGVMHGNDRCSGLLFADDVAGLCETEEDAQAFLDGISHWSADWCMPVGAKKCGVMLVGGTEEEQTLLAERPFTIAGQTVEVVRKYKYLGIWITDSLGDNERTDEMSHCRTLAAKVKTAVDMRRAFLRDPKFPLEIKLAVIQSKIISLGLYGGEWVGMCQKRTDIIQTQVNVALKLVLHSSSNSNMHASRVMSWELGVPTIEERMADLRIRLWQKAPRMKSWISVLVDKRNRLVDRARPWSGQTAYMVKLMMNPGTRNAELYDTWQVKTLLREGKARRYDPNREESPEQRAERERQELKLRIIVRSFDNSRANNEATSLYSQCLFGESRRYIKAAAHMPFLAEGIIWLVRIRTSSWWTTRRRKDFLSHAGRSHEHLPMNGCPCCGAQLEELELEIHHILYDCPMWNKERERWLKPLINVLRELIYQSHDGVACPNRPEMELGEMTSRLLGGSLNPIVVDGEHPNMNDYPNWEPRTTGALQPFSRGWGGEPEFYAPGFSTHLYIPVAMFLSKVMPKHKARLFSDGRANTDPLVYARLSREETTSNRCRQWVNALVDWRQDDGGEFTLRSTEARHSIPPWKGFYQANAPIRGMAQYEDALAMRDADSAISGAETGSDYWA